MRAGHRHDAVGARSAPRRLRTFALAILAALAVRAAGAEAQLAVGRVELVMQPGDRTSRDATIGVRNESDKPVQAIVRLEDWDRAADGANQWYPYGTRPKGSCAPALSIFPQSLRLEAGAEQAIRVALDSARAPARECWAAAVVETVQPAERAGQRVAYVIRTAVKIYVQPAGLIAEGEIESLRVQVDSAVRGRRISTLELAFVNTGARHVVAQGAIEVRTADNTLVQRIPLPTVYALPGARHAVRVPVPKLAPGTYVFLATMDYGGADIAAALLEHRAR